MTGKYARNRPPDEVERTSREPSVVRPSANEARSTTRWTVRTYVVSDGETLYLFALRNLAENYVRNSPVFEQIVATTRLPPAR